MLIVDRDSWHFKVVKWVWKDDYYLPRDFCSYVRALVLWAPGKLFIGILIYMFKAIAWTTKVLGIQWALRKLGSAIAWTFRAVRLPWLFRQLRNINYTVNSWMKNHEDKIGIAFLIFIVALPIFLWFQVPPLALMILYIYGGFAVMVIVVIVIATSAVVVEELKDKASHTKNKNGKPYPKVKKTLGIWVWIKAKKRGICPLIKYNTYSQTS